MVFLLFLAGLALVNLKGVQNSGDSRVTSATQLSNTSWRPTYLGDLAVPADTSMFVEFSSDDVLGHGGCNRILSKFQLADGGLTIAPLSSTRMSCEGIAMSNEMAFISALESARSATRHATQLILRDEEGTIVSRLIAIESAPARPVHK